METKMAALEALLGRFISLREEIKTQLETELTGVLQEYINRVPGLLAVHWTQGTPSFNDGDPCHFSVGEPTYIFEAASADPRLLNYKPYYNKSEARVPEPLVDLLGNWSDSDLEKVFEVPLNTAALSVEPWSLPKIEGPQVIQEVLNQVADFMEDVYGGNVEVLVSRTAIAITDADMG